MGREITSKPEFGKSNSRFHFAFLAGPLGGGDRTPGLQIPMRAEPLRSCRNLRMPDTVAIGHEQFAFFAGAHSRSHRRRVVDFHQLAVDGFDLSSMPKTDAADLASRNGAKSRAFQRVAHSGGTRDRAPLPDCGRR